MKLKWEKTICCLMIIILGTMWGCGNKKEPQSDIENNSPNGNVVHEEVNQKAPEDVLEADKKEYLKQVSIIVNNRDIWCLPAEYENETYEYAITDLDENGRLEIIISDMGGSGSYSHNFFYEVNKELDGIVKMHNPTEQEKTQPDILIDFERVYIDSDGVHHYIVTDYLKQDEHTYYITIGVMSISENQISHEYLASRTEVETDKGVKAAHKDYAGNDISEDEYYRVVKEYFEGYPEWKVHIEWQNARELKDMNEQELLQELSKSAEQFVFEKVNG